MLVQAQFLTSPLTTLCLHHCLLYLAGTVSSLPIVVVVVSLLCLGKWLLLSLSAASIWQCSEGSTRAASHAALTPLNERMAQCGVWGRHAWSQKQSSWDEAAFNVSQLHVGGGFALLLLLPSPDACPTHFFHLFASRVRKEGA